MTKDNLFSSSVFFLIIFYYFIFPASSLDSLRQGDFLDESSRLVSANKLFAIRFYNHHPNFSPNIYLAIWFSTGGDDQPQNSRGYDRQYSSGYDQQRSVGNIVWIGNRNTPIQNSSALLILDTLGNLLIKSHESDHDSVELYSVPGRQRKTNATATLLDNGNFVLRETYSNGSFGKVLWQSFDYPTNTLLPGMKLGVNHRTGLNWTLTSWFSGAMPREGAFTLEWDTTKLRLLVKHRGVIYWTSGIMKSFEFDGTMYKEFEFFDTDPDYINYQFISVANEDEEYFSYEVRKGPLLRAQNNMPVWVLQDDGKLQDQVGHDIAEVELCSGFKSKIKGCEIWEQPTCRISHQKFVKSVGSFEKRDSDGRLRVFDGHFEENINLSLSDCKETCWKDCNCVGFKYFSSIPGCQIWKGPNVEFNGHQTNEGYTTGDYPYVLISKPQYTTTDIAQGPRSSSSTCTNFLSSRRGQLLDSELIKGLIIATAVVVPTAILLFGLFCYLKRIIRQGKRISVGRYLFLKFVRGIEQLDKVRRFFRNLKKEIRKELRKGKEEKLLKGEEELLELTTLEGYTDTIVLDKDEYMGQDLKFFSYSCIVAATNNFSAENKLGEGGFGPVYKGKLPKGEKIAVKRLSISSAQGLHEFKTELVLIAKLQHTNLVRIYGCCIHGDEKMLIYEYMRNKSLDSFLFDHNSSLQLTWKGRFSIIEGIAQGLLYLHKYSRLRIVHRDLKASNILLDENMNPKISDFGTARIFKKNSSEVNTSKIAGTRGYMAPEYVMEGTCSVKSDVYSFGILILEIVSGRKNNSFYEEEGPLNLVAYAWDLWNKNVEIELMDPALAGSSTIHDQLLKCIHIGLLCVQHSAVHRPTMSDVVSMLSNDSSALPQPKSPAFVPSPTLMGENQSKPETFSDNGLSISEIVSR